MPVRSSRSRMKNSGFIETRSLAFPLDPDPIAPPPYDKADLSAFKALREGRAEPYQQQLCLEWMVYICGTYETPYRSGADDAARATSFALAKQWVGQQIVKMVNMPMISDEQGEQG